MDQAPQGEIVRRDRSELAIRLVRWALVVYLSPVILVVMALGLAGMIAAKIGKPGGGIAVEGIHPAHEANRPLGMARVRTKVFEKV